MALQITRLSIVHSTVYSGADHRKHQCSASLAFMRVIHQSPVNSPHKGPVSRKIFPFDDVIMIYRWWILVTNLAADMLYLCVWVHGIIWFIPDEIYSTVAFNCQACSFRGSSWHLEVHECVFSNWPSLVQVARCCLRGIQQLTKPILACHQYLFLTLYSKENRKLMNTRKIRLQYIRHSSVLQAVVVVGFIYGKYKQHNQALTHCGPLTWYDDRDRDKHWLR